MPWERDVDIRVRAQTLSARRVSDGTWRSARATRDGALFTAEWFQALIGEGRGFVAGIGLLSAGEALPNAQVITTLRPTFVLRVPTGTTILPFYGAVQVEDSGGTAALEMNIGTAGSDVGNGTSSAADFGPINLKTNATRGSLVVPRQEYTGNSSADPDNDQWRKWMTEDNAATPATVGSSNFEWEPYPFCPELVGPASLIFTIGGALIPIITAQFKWVELETTEIA